MRKKNTFTTTVMQMSNTMLAAIRSEIIAIRMQITISDQVDKLRGWDDATNEWIKENLATVQADLDALLKAKASPVPMSRQLPRTSLGEDLTGNDPNLPQPTQQSIRNTGLRLLVEQLDLLTVTLSQFNSRNAQTGINNLEHRQAEAILTRCYEICERHGGDANDRPLISGTLPADIDDTFNPTGDHDTELGRLDDAETTGIDAQRASTTRRVPGKDSPSQTTPRRSS